MSSEVVTTKREYNGGTAEIHTIATPTGYRVTGNYHTTGRNGRLVDGLVGGNIVAADDIDAEVERVAKLADAAIGNVIAATDAEIERDRKADEARMSGC